MTTMRIILLSFLMMIFQFGVSFSQDASNNKTTEDTIDIAGLYRCEGANYKGTVSIKKVGNSYKLKWKIGKQGYVGVALREGNILSSSWLAGRRNSGVIVYKIEKGPKLVGKFATYRGNGKTQKETLTFLKKIPKFPKTRSWSVNETLLVNWSQDNYWYPAKIIKKEGERYYVNFNDGDSEWVNSSQMTKEDILVGDRVSGNWKGKDGYYLGTVTKREGNSIHIKYDDGDEETTTISSVRVIRPREP